MFTDHIRNTHTKRTLSLGLFVWGEPAIACEWHGIATDALLADACENWLHGQGGKVFVAIQANAIVPPRDSAFAFWVCNRSDIWEEQNICRHDLNILGQAGSTKSLRWNL